MEELRLQGKISPALLLQQEKGILVKAQDQALQNRFARSRGPGRNLRMKSGCLVFFFFFFLQSKKGEANGNAPTVGNC